jgi:ubiquinone/menaquinone biosynthesis C-methylase UbiE
MSRRAVKVNIEDPDSLDILLHNISGPVSVVPCIPLRYFEIKEPVNNMIENLVRRLDKKALDFEMLPSPPCVSQSRSKHVSQTNEPRFFMDVGLIIYISDKDFGYIEGNHETETMPMCSDCNYRKKRECLGAYTIKAHKETQRFQKWIFNEIPAVKNGRLLDLGCGIAPYLPFYKRLVKENSFSCYLVDPPESCIKSLNKMIPKGFRSSIKTITGMAEDLDFDNDFFDVIIMIASYAHFFDLDKSLENIYNVLKKNGTVYIYDTYEDDKRFVHSKSAEKYLGKMELKRLILEQKEFREHSLPEAVNELKKGGFAIIDSFEYRKKSGGTWGIKAGRLLGRSPYVGAASLYRLHAWRA